MGIWQGPGGIEVEAVVFDDRPCLRVTRSISGERVLVAYCSDVYEVDKLVDLAELVKTQ